jgi:Concanavalin A-like lectin/glucanases superfamily
MRQDQMSREPSPFRRFLFLSLLGLLAVVLGWIFVRTGGRHGQAERAAVPAVEPIRSSPPPSTAANAGANFGGVPSAIHGVSSNGVPEREMIASAWKTDPLPVFAAFAEWVEKYLAAPPDRRAQLTLEGIEIAKARRAVLFELIERDPRRALAAAIPMSVRDQLPPEVVALLENRVSGYGNLFRISTYGADPGSKPYFDYAQIGGEDYFAYRYGRRESLFELKGASLHGVALDKRLAVLDSPVYGTEIGQTLAERPINEVCLYSGQTIVTPGQGTVADADSAPIQVGTQLLGLCSPAHAIYIESTLQNLEAAGQPVTTNGVLNVGLLSQYIHDPSPLTPLAYGGTGGTGWPGQPSTNLTYGNKRAIVYRVQIPDWTAFPGSYTETLMTNTILGDQCTICYSGQPTKTVSNQLYEFSWGKVVVTQALVTPVIILPKTYAQYTNNYFGPILQDAKEAAANLGFDTNVEFHVIVHSDLQAPNLSACAWGGGGAVWVNQCWGVGVLVHEFGHVFGLPHANGWDISDLNVWSPTRTHVEYDDLTDPMGQGNGQQKNHYNSFFKYFIHWYPESLVSNITVSGTYRVYQFDDINAPLTNTFALLLRHDAVSSYWISLRGNTPSGNFGNAAYIQEVQNNKNDTHLMDFNTPDANNANGGLTVGQSYYDSTANVTLQNVAIGGTAPLRWMDFNIVIGETPALRAQYRLENDVQDSSGNGYHGALSGGTAFVPGRIYARALNFNGVDGYATIPRSISNDFSIAFWVRTTAVGGAGQWYNGRGLVDATAGTQTNDFGVTLIGTKAAFGVGAPDTTITSLTSINNGQWHHVVAARNKTSGEMRLYVDGVLEATGTGSTGTLDAASELRLGMLETGLGPFPGDIDDVRIYNYLLGPGEIAALATMPSAPHQAGTLYADLRAVAGQVTPSGWVNQAPFATYSLASGAPGLTANVAGTGLSGVSFNGTSDAFQGPNTVSDLDGSSDRTIEVWAYNPALATEETMVSWGHRGSNGRNLGFNFGNSTGFGAVTHYGPNDVPWGTPPTAGAWHYLVYTYQNSVAQVYVDGVLRNSKTLSGALNTFANEPINIGCQRDSANGTRSFFYSGYLNTVRIHGGVLSSDQILANYLYGTWVPSAPPGTPSGLTASPRIGQVRLRWDVSSGGASGYTIKRSTGSGGPYTNLAVVSTQSFTDTNVNNGASYYYVVAAGNFFGQSTNSSEASATAVVTPQPIIAGTLYVDLRATDPSAGSATWLNQGTLGDFTEIGGPIFVGNVNGTGRAGVSFNGTTDAYLGPNSVSDIDGGGDRTIEVWAYNPSLPTEESMVSWGHRGTTRRDIAFNFGTSTMFGAATHWADDVPWGVTPSANAWHHLVYTYSSNVVSVYVDGSLRNSKTLGGALDTFPNEPINIACQRESNGNRSLLYSGYLNAVRIHGGVLTPDQIQSNYLFGLWMTNSAPFFVPVSDKTIISGATLSVTNVALDANSSQQTLTFSLLNAPGTATIGPSNGVFLWRPTLANSGTTNPVTVKVVDNGSPILSATQSFNVRVTQPATPVLSTPGINNGAFQLWISGDAGPDYTILGSTNLTDWITLLTTNSPGMPFLFEDPAVTNFDRRFYRIQLGP